MAILSMQDTLTTFHQACENFQTPDQNTQTLSHQFLVAFIDNPHLFPVCDHVLRNAHNNAATLFHSAICLRQGALRRWSSLVPQNIEFIQANLLEYVMIHAHNSGAKSAVSTLIGGIAVVLKRAWGDMSTEAREAYFQGLQEHLLTGDVPAISKRVGLEIITAIVTEFSPTTATPLGLPWDYHQMCRKDFQGFLRRLFNFAAEIGSSVVSIGTPIDGNDGVCSACLELVHTVLNWDFEQSPQVIGQPASEKVVIKLERPWLIMLYEERVLDWILKLLELIWFQNMPPDSKVSICARQMLVTLCSLVGSNMSSDAQDQNMRDSYIGSLLLAIRLWIQPADAAMEHAQSSGGDEQVDACKALLALSRSCSISELLRARRSDPACIHVFHDAAGFFLSCLKARGLSDEAEGTWLQRCTDMLLEFWSGFFQAGVDGEGFSAPNIAQLHPDISPLPTQVFDDFLAALLGQAAEEALQIDDEDGEGDMTLVLERLCNFATIGRACARHSTKKIRELLLLKLQATISHPMNEKATAIRLEELVCLLQVAVSLIADDVEGETAMIPPTMVVQTSHGTQDLVEPLSHAILQVASLCLQREAKNIISPRLMEVSVRVLTRWCDTYLLQSETPSPQLECAFGANANGLRTLQQVCEIANICLVAFPGEGYLHRLVCEKLFPTLTRRKEVHKWLLECPAWQQLFTAFASQENALKQLGEKLHRHLARSLSTVAECIQSDSERTEYVFRLMRKLAGETSETAGCLSSGKKGPVSGLPLRICTILEALRGVALGTQQSPKSQKATFQIFLELFQPLLTIQDAFIHHYDVVYCLLRFAGDLVEGHIVFLEALQTQRLCEWVLKLLQIYSAHHAGAHDMEVSRLLKEQRDAEQGKDVRALLVLIKCIGDKDIVDFGSAGADVKSVNIAEVVLVGLNLVIPLMTADLLKFPKVCKQYFDVLAHILEVYPEHVIRLNDNIFQQLMRTLEFGLRHTDDRVVQLTLEALSGLTTFHCKERLKGLEGLANRFIGGTETAPIYFLKLLFQLLLLSDQSQGTVEYSTGSLLSLILSEQLNYQDVCHRIFPPETSQDVHHLVDGALSKLIQIGPNLDPFSRPGRSKFRSNLCKFVADIRGAMKVC